MVTNYNTPLPVAKNPKDPKGAERRAIKIRDEDILSNFANATDKNEQLEILKELFDISKLELITDLSPDHIALITRMSMISKLKNIPQWEEGLELFMKLRISNKRQSRRELISAIQGINQNRSFMDKMKDKFFN